MNLLDKIWSGLMICSVLTIFSCEDATDIGLGLDPDGLRVNVLYKELLLESTNVYIDSVKTSDSRILIGKSTSDLFGTITSSSFNQLQAVNPVGSIDDSLSYVIDSAVLYLDIIDVDTDMISATQNFDIYQLSDTLYSDPYYLSNFEIPYNTSLKKGELSFVLDPIALAKIDDASYLESTRLEDFVATELFEIMQKDGFSSILKDEYKGIAIVPRVGNTALIGVNPVDSTSLRVFFHVIDPYTENGLELDSVFTDSLFVSFSLSSGSAYFNHVEVDRSGSVLGSVINEDQPLVSFDAGTDKVYLHPISGVFPKIDLSVLTDFFDAHENIQINRMEIELKSDSIESNYITSVNDFRFFFIGEDNTDINHVGQTSGNLFLTNILTDNSYLGSGAQSALSALKSSNMTYTGVPTIFTQLIETRDLDVSHLLLMPNDLNSAKYGIFDKNTGVKVKLYYTLPE